MCEKKETIYSYRKQVGELKSKLHKTQLLVVEYMREMGCPYESIAEELDISVAYARSLCSELGDLYD